MSCGGRAFSDEKSEGSPYIPIFLLSKFESYFETVMGLGVNPLLPKRFSEVPDKR
jgi:hypothetical protein